MQILIVVLLPASKTIREEIVKYKLFSKKKIQVFELKNLLDFKEK